MQYMLAEAISQRHEILVVTKPEAPESSVSSAQKILCKLPYNLSRDPDVRSTTDNGKAQEDPGNHLKIAWQYEKYLTKG